MKMKHALKHCSYKRSYIYPKRTLRRTFIWVYLTSRESPCDFIFSRMGFQTALLRRGNGELGFTICDHINRQNIYHLPSNMTSAHSRASMKNAKQDMNIITYSHHPFLSLILNQNGSPLSKVMTCISGHLECSLCVYINHK